MQARNYSDVRENGIGTFDILSECRATPMQDNVSRFETAVRNMDGTEEHQDPEPPWITSLRHGLDSVNVSRGMRGA